MNEQELRAVVEGIAPVLKAFVDERVAKLAEEIEARVAPDDTEKCTAAAFTKALMARFDSELVCG